MDKELPKVYANKIDKELDNNDTYSYNMNNDETRISKEKETVVKDGKIEKNILQKIDDIFKSPRYVYKADVVIKTKEGESVYKVIGKNYNSLITIDNELIKIDDILDIHFSD